MGDTGDGRLCASPPPEAPVDVDNGRTTGEDDETEGATAMWAGAPDSKLIMVVGFVLAKEPSRDPRKFAASSDMNERGPSTEDDRVSRRITGAGVVL